MLWAANPLIVVLAGGHKSPFMFSAAWNLGALVSVFVYFKTRHPDLIRWEFLKSLAPTKTTFAKSFKQIKTQTLPVRPFNWQIFVSMLTPIGGLMFVWSFRFLPSVVIAVVRESWPVFAALLLQQMFRQEKRFQLNARTLSLFAFIFGGVALVVLSAASGGGALSGLGWSSLAGVALLAGALLFNICRYLQFGWVENTHADSDPEDLDTERSKIAHRMLFSLFAFAVGSVISIAGSLVSYNHSLTVGGLAFTAVSAAAICLGGSLCSAAGVLKAGYNPRIQSVRYLTPAFAVTYLLAAGFYKDVDSSFFVLGLAAVVSGNVLVNSPEGSRLAGIVPAVCVWVAGLSALGWAVAV